MAFNILIVDDSATVRAMIVKTLKLTQLPLSEVHQATNGREALDVLEEKWIDLVLTDINMPEMDGIELVGRMAENGIMQNVPVVVVSTEGSQVRIAELKQQGIRGYLRKPFTPEDLKEMVENVLQN